MPQSNAAPTIVLTNGKPFLALGSAGSRRIVSSLVQVISAVIDNGFSLADALALPRAHPLVGGGIWAEKPLGQLQHEELQKRFGSLRQFGALNYKFGAVQAIGWSEGQVIGAADPRRDGKTAC